MIRQATLNDVELVTQMTVKFLSTTKHKDITDEDKTRQTIKVILSSPHMAIFLYGEVGMIAGVISEFPFGNHLVASELGWWVEPEYRKSEIGKELLDTFEDWATVNKCEKIFMVTLDDSVGKYYEKRGYEIHERTYVKDIRNS